MDTLHQQLSMNSGAPVGSAHRIEDIEEKLTQLEKRISASHNDEDRRFSHYSSLVDKGFEGLSAEKRAREALNEAKTKEMQLTDSRLQLALEVEQQAREDAEALIRQTLEESV